MTVLRGTGPGGYTSQSIREAWRRAFEEGKSWKETGGRAETTEAAERALILAARYAKVPSKVAKTVSSNCLLTQVDEAIVAMTTAYCCVLAFLVERRAIGVRLIGQVDGPRRRGMSALSYRGQRYALVTQSGREPSRAGRFSFPDALLTPSYMAEAALDPGIRTEPAWKVSIVYGMPCAIYHQLPISPTIWPPVFMTTSKGQSSTP